MNPDFVKKESETVCAIAGDQERIFLVGFMGAGKSTVGPRLAKDLGFQFVDLDKIIETNAGKTVREIFLEQGETEFRRLESEALVSCCEMKRVVVAVGGGCFTFKKNREIMRKFGKSVWLDCPFGICLIRVKGDKSRPLVSGESEMRALFEKRRHFYAMADYVLKTGGASAKEIASQITQLLTG